MYYSVKLDIPYLGSTISEIKTFRPESLSHETMIGDYKIIITSNEDFTGVTLETFNQKENVTKCNMYLPFPEHDQIQEPFPFPGNLFKLSLKTVKMVQKAAVSGPNILYKDIVKDPKGTPHTSNEYHKNDKRVLTHTCPLLSFSEESKKKVSTFTCDVQQSNNKSPYSSCIQIAMATKKNIYLW